jgi:hypothetical protein
VAVPPEGSGLQVGVDPRRGIDARAAAARLSAAAGVPVNVVIEGPSRPFGRIDDRAPWSAGGGAMVRVNDGGSERWAACSLGYGLRDPRTMREYTITAAHCFDEAVDATAWNGNGRAAIGDWSAMSLALDVAYVATDEPAGQPGTSARVWSGGADAADGGVRTVTDTAPTVKGMWVCGSGAATGENCGIKVTDVDVMQRATLPRSGAAYTVRHTARGYRPGGGVASGSGDSGGPVFARGGPGHGDAQAVGVIHGGVEGAGVSCGGAPGPTECSESVIFVPVAEVQRWIGGELRMADGWRSSPRPGPAADRPSVGQLLDLPGLDAARADVDASGRAVDHGAHTLDVGVPPTLGPPVRVADTHAPRRVLATHLAYGCHRTRHLCLGLAEDRATVLAVPRGHNS